MLAIDWKKNRVDSTRLKNKLNRVDSGQNMPNTTMCVASCCIHRTNFKPKEKNIFELINDFLANF
ncbi:hypothetical protein BpHYR1_043796 [Brachionus plicatilis]|uniref:Uncharacterized protein n=1 Tax=Brachionus plicatilis TaxID=10195 RepID=A0A3M7QNN5_BRAPC|nr:hypothetical protein BpHYR1_043796 [Brachionus plicatilis]